MTDDTDKKSELGNSPEEIARDVRAVAQIEAVPTLLQVLCETTGMGFAAVARVTGSTWTACAVQDSVNFGLKAGGQLDVDSTLCIEVRQSRTPIAIDHASQDPRYCAHHTPRIYSIESYVSVPIVLPDGRYFGNLCAIDPKPKSVSEPRVVSMFNRFAQLIGLQLDSELTHQRERAALLDERAASELREQFIAVLGHDLRNPLAAISAAGALLSRSLHDQALAGYASRILANVRRMSELIDDVLDFARGRLGGGIGIQLRESAAVETALDEVLKEFQTSHPGKVVVGNLHVSSVVKCDLVRLQQVVSNLVANALAHGSGRGGVKFSAASDDQDLVLEVWNDGEPITPDRMDSIFAPFSRATAYGAGQGLGLGLYICSEIVKAHRGTIAVTSTREHGTLFTVRIPLRAHPRNEGSSTAVAQV